jgi:uncharacterized membrane protein YhaH (DUF805 family)
MKGKILHYDSTTQEGIISANNGSRYSFKKNDVKSMIHIQKGMDTEFTTEQHDAKDIYVTENLSHFCEDGLPFYEEQKYSFKELFSAKGCYTRLQFWKITLISFVIWALFGLYIVLTNSNTNEIPDENVIVIVAMVMFLLLPMIYINIVTSIKRFHDNNKSGWFYLLSLIPYLGSFILLVMNGFMPTVKEGNRYCRRKKS